MKVKYLLNHMIMQQIQKLRIFEGLSHETIQTILNNAQTENFHNGDIILKEGEGSNGKAYIIISGKVNIIIEKKIIAQLSEGEIFGEIALLNEEQRVATVQAVDEVTTLIITQDTILNMINDGNDTINRGIMDRIEQNLNFNPQN